MRCDNLICLYTPTGELYSSQT